MGVDSASTTDTMLLELTVHPNSRLTKSTRTVVKVVLNDADYVLGRLSHRAKGTTARVTEDAAMASRPVNGWAMNRKQAIAYRRAVDEVYAVA